MQDHERLRIYVLKGRRTTLAWCRDKHHDWRAELERRETAPTLSNIKIEGIHKRLRAYDPWTNRWISVNNGALPDFRRSLILRGA
jgi:hypothetical protein